MKTYIVLLLMVLLAGCVTKPPPTVWYNQSSRQTFEQAKYSCLQESQQNRGGVAWNQAGGAAQSGVITNGGLFNSCMTSRGFVLVSVTEADRMNSESAAHHDDWKALNDRLNQEAFARCSNPVFAPVTSHAPCKLSDTTLENFADSSRITEAQKPLLSELAKLNQDARQQRIDFLSKIVPQPTEVIKRWQESGRRFQDNSTALYLGKETWGEWNVNRKKINDEVFTPKP
jgi:hypothetical protein